jgi:hypothetical protein
MKHLPYSIDCQTWVAQHHVGALAKSAAMDIKQHN